MKITFDTQNKTVTTSDGRTVSLFDKESFDVLSDLWVRVGWVRKYSYGFSWMGRPIIQLPDDMVRIQEAIYLTTPDVIIETGVAHGGSLVYYASLFEAMNRGRVIGVDLEIRPHNRQAIESHPMKKRITLFEGDSCARETVNQVKAAIQPGERVMVILDSDHSKGHVLKELQNYAPLVTPGCYLLVQDGVMELVAGMPRTNADWQWNHPNSAVDEFLDENRQFRRIMPPRPFDESEKTPDASHHPRGWLERIS